MRRLKRVVVLGVGTGLFAASWVLLGALAVGNRVLSPIPRSRVRRDTYV